MDNELHRKFLIQKKSANRYIYHENWIKHLKNEIKDLNRMLPI